MNAAEQHQLTCPTCGCPVALHIADEGTSSYEPVLLAELVRTREALARIAEYGEKRHDGRTAANVCKCGHPESDHKLADQAGRPCKHKDGNCLCPRWRKS